MKRLIFIVILATICSNALAQQSTNLNTYTFDQLEFAFAKADKPAVIFLHTDWCKYCAAMTVNTFQNAEVKKLLNKNFFYVPFNAESKKPVRFNGVDYSFKPSGRNTGTHEIALALVASDKPIAYPMMVVINRYMEILYQYSGFMDASEMINVLKSNFTKE
jgi:thioredoxin-related protein